MNERELERIENEEWTRIMGGRKAERRRGLREVYRFPIKLAEVVGLVLYVLFDAAIEKWKK